MKKIFTLLFMSAALLNFASAQNLVSTALQGRNAVLEEFTGLNCPNCPDGHTRAQALVDAHPGRVAWINVHSGYFAVPSAGQPDYRIPEGDSIDVFAGVAAYPSGTMNRIVWPGAYNIPPYFPQNPPNQLAIRRPGWWDTGYPGQGAGEYIILNGGTSHVNIGAASTWDDVTRTLNVTVELYYTIDDTVSNKLNVVLAENNIIGYQSNGGNNYVHKHMIRHMITPLWGDVIPVTAQGTLETRNYTYVVPVNFDIDNCEISIFVTRNDNKTTHTGLTFPAKNGSTVGVNAISEPSFTLGIYPNPVNTESVMDINLVKKANSKIEITDVAGRIIFSKDLGELNIGWNSYLLNEWINLSKAGSGIYFLRFTAGQESTVKKISIE